MRPSPHVIHMAQCPVSVSKKALLIFLEVVLVPGALLALLGGAGQVTLGIVAVFAWRILVAAVRIGLVGMLPVTSILTFGLLSARTGAGATFGLADLGNPLVAYVLPGCLVSLAASVYFILNGRTDRPILMKIVQDFVKLSEEAQERLRPLFSRLTVLVGVLQAFFATTGAIVVLAASQEQASVITGVLTVATPLVLALGCLVAGILMLRQLQLRISFRTPVLPSQA